MENLIIFSSHFIPSNTSQREWLFDQYNSKSIQPIEENSSFGEGGNKKSFFRLETEHSSQLVYIHNSFDNELAPHDRSKYLSYLLKNALKDIESSDHKGTFLKSISFILHRGEIGAKHETNRIRFVNGASFFPILQTTFEVFDKGQVLVQAPIDEIETLITETEITVDFVEFKHEPNNLVFDLLTQFPWELKEKDIGKLIKNRLDAYKGVPEQAWSLPTDLHEGFQQIKSFLLELGLRFKFEVYYPIQNGNKYEIKKFHRILTKSGAKQKACFEEIAEGFQKFSEKSENKVDVLLCSIKHLEDFEFFKQVPEFFFGIGQASNWSPLITIGYKDIFAEDWENKLKNGSQALKFNLDKRFRFIDSSIWCRYIGIGESVDQFIENFKNVFNTIVWAFKNRLYYKNITREYVELQNRLLKNSFLFEQYGEHSSYVFPFTFHSETVMEKLAQKTTNDFQTKANVRVLQNSKFVNRQYPKGFQWNFLFIDDFANLILSEPKILKASDQQIQEKTKEEIVKDLILFPPGYESAKSLKGLQWNHDPKSYEFENKRKKEEKATSSDLCFFNWIAEFVAVESVAEAILQLLGETQIRNAHTGSEDIIQRKVEITYDIILLDYLFSRTDDKIPHFGTDLLEAIQNDKVELSQGKTILNSFWIHPVSAFSDALQSAFEEKSMQHFNEHWQLARGADPINTPHKFRNSLYGFMNAQLSKLYFSEKDIFEFLLEDKLSTFKQKGLNGSPVKQWALLAFRNFIERFSNNENKEELPLKGGLRESINDKWKEPGNNSWELKEHLRQLLYFLGHSTGFDTLAIQNEFSAIRNYFYEYKYHLQKDQKTYSKEVRDKLEEIEKEILELGLAIYRVDLRYKS